MKTGHDEAHAVRVVEHAIERGVTFLDTSSVYGTEAAVGRAIRAKRDRVVVSTKASVRLGERLSSASELAASLEHSLLQLRTDHVDVFHLHSLRIEQYPHCLDVLLPELQRQRDAGKIRFIGATEMFDRDPSHQMLCEVIPSGHFDVVMMGFNLLNPSAREHVFPAARGHDVGTLVMFAVRRALSRPDVLSELLDRLVVEGMIDATGLDRADPLGFVRGHGVASVVEAAYRFCRHEAAPSVILTGTGDTGHLDANIDAILAPPLPDALLTRLSELFGAVDSVSGQ